MAKIVKMCEIKGRTEGKVVKDLQQGDWGCSWPFKILISGEIALHHPFKTCVPPIQNHLPPYLYCPAIKSKKTAASCPTIGPP